MNNADLVISHIKSLEAQLRVLKAEIESPSAPPVESGHSFADLYGQLHGQVESSEEEIDAILYRLPEDEEDQG